MPFCGRRNVRLFWFWLPLAAVGLGVVMLVFFMTRPRKPVPLEIPILMYHHIGEGRGVWWVRPEVFEDQLRQLKAAGYESVWPEQVVAAFEGRGRLPPRPVMLTFDDGYRSMLTEVEPRLARYGFRGVVFLITASIAERADERREWDGEPCLTWEEVRVMQRRGVLTFGGHGHTHANLAALTDPEEEIASSYRHIRRKAGFRPMAFGYPYGAYGEQTWMSVEKAGYRMAVICEDRLAHVFERKDLFHLPRWSVYGGERRLEGEWLTDEDGRAVGWAMRLTGVGQPVRLAVWREGVDVPLWQSERIRLRNGERREFRWDSDAGPLWPPLRLEVRDGSGLFRLPLADGREWVVYGNEGSAEATPEG